jgi:capsular exopolysaccharide synthesis family protein
VVDPARPPDRPARPRKGRALELALLLGLAAGFGIALLVDRMDLTVRSAEDAESLLKLPCLAMLQHLEDVEMTKGNRFEPIWTGTRSQAGEAFRNLRTAVSFRLASVKGPTVLLVTSAVQEEGKSFIAANIARAFAQAGEAVLLIDGDLRRPSVHRIFGITGEDGLSTYLTGGRVTGQTGADQNGNGQHADEPPVQEAGVTNLSLLSSGPIPDNPAELLGDARLNDLIAWAGQRYTRIVVDSPPVFPVTDALLWTRHAHGVVVVVRAGATRAALVGRALHRLKDGFANVIGAVLNQSSPESLEYYRYYHGYYAAEKGKQEAVR